MIMVMIRLLGVIWRWWGADNVMIMWWGEDDGEMGRWCDDYGEKVMGRWCDDDSVMELQWAAADGKRIPDGIEILFFLLFVFEDTANLDPSSSSIVLSPLDLINQTEYLKRQMVDLTAETQMGVSNSVTLSDPQGALQR